MNKEIQVRIILRHKTSREWEQIGDSEVLFKGEIGLEFIGGNNVPKIKIGDGITPWKKLKYYHPTKYNWNDLMGATYDFQRGTTPGLKLNKPGAKDIVNLVALNENFDILDSNYNRQLQEIKNLQEGINNLTSIIDSSELNSVEAEVVLARTINNITYGSLSEALNALNRNLQTLAAELKNKTPTGIKITEDGAIYLADANGSIIGEEVRVIDLELRDEVEDARKRSNGVTYESIGKTLRAIDDDLQLEINNLKNELEEKANQEDIDNSIQEVELALSAHIEEANNANLAIQESLESISENITTVAEELSNELKEQENALNDLSVSFNNYKTEAENQNSEFLEQLNNQNKDIENLENLLNYKEQQLNNSIELQSQNFDKKLDNYKKEVSENFQISDSKIRRNTQRISSLEDEIENLPSLFPDNLVYEDNILYLAVGDEIIETSGVEIVGGGGGGGIDTSYKIELTAEERNISKPLGEQIILKYKYLSYDREDNTINDGPGSGALLVDNIQRATFRVVQGDNTLDVTQYLRAGENTLKIKVTNSEGSSKIMQFNIVLLSLTISTNFPKLSYQEVGLLPISYTVNSEAEFTSHFVLTKQNARPGEQYHEPTEVFTETFNKGTTSTADIKPLPSGAYSLEIYATSGDTSSNKIVIGLIMYSSSDITPFIVMIPERTTFSQGETVSIPYLVYDPNNTFPTITFSIYSLSEQNEQTLFYSESFSIDRTPKKITAQSYPTGTVIFEISCANIKNSVIVNIEESDVELELFTENLIFEFDPIGRTNQNSANNWSYTDKDGKTYTAEFKGIDWGELDGWQIKKDEEGRLLEDQTMLRILPGGSVTIPFKPFENEIVNNNVGYTIELELATQNVTNYESLIIDIFDEDKSQRGLRVYSQSAELKSRENSISAQFKEDDRVRLTFTIEPSTLNKLIMIYINGVLCGIKKYDEDAFLNGSPIIVGAEDNGVDLYFIRAYKRVLDGYQQLNNFCVDRPSFTEKVSAKIRNDILNASAGGDLAKMITIDSLKGSVPYIIMHCSSLPENKENKIQNAKMTFVDPANPNRSFTAEGCTFSVQGTSSAGYPVKNFKIKLDKKKGIVYTRNGQNDLKGFYFEGKEKSQPTQVFCLKADYASSESANNVMLVDYYNQTCPYRNEAQKYQTDNGQPETVRHGVHGEPIVLFWQEINPVTGEGSGEIHFQGKYNFNDDKDSENVFGYVGVLPEDIFNIQCWEFKNNNMDLCLFKHNLTEGNNAWFKEVEDDKGKMVPAWSNSFERRFPEQEDEVVPDLTAFRRMVDWVASTNTIDAYNTELTTPIYYRTLDKKYDDKKTYYKKNEDGTFSLFKVAVEDATFSYSPAIRINNLIMIPKIQSLLETETRPIDLIFSKKENSNWRLYYIDNEIEVELVGDISNLTEYGIAFDTSSNLYIESLEGFSIQFYKSNDWTSQLYEYHTHDTSSYRLAKFKNEFEDYFILDAMAYYYVFTETVLLMDNRAKNMFLVCYDVDSKLIYDENGKVIGSKKQTAGTYGHWAPTPYDMDSALGIDNDGELVYSYHLEDDGRDGQVFTGQASVLWNNFRDCFQDKIAEKYFEIREQHGTTNGSMPFSYETLSKKMNNHQDAWPEIIWNIDQQIKYLKPFYDTNGATDHLAKAQGDKRAQRNFWLYNAFKYRDSKYSAGDALNNYIFLRLNGHSQFDIVPYSNIYARVKFGNALDLKKRALRNTTSTFTTEGISSVYNLETYIYSADRISSIGDLSNFNIGHCDFASASKLKELILGSEREGYKNTYLKNFRAGASTVLQEVNLSNCINLAMGINLEKCPNLQTFKAAGSAITGVTFARGARLSTCKLPKSMAYLSLLDLKYLNEEGLYIETKENGKYAFTGIRIENCPNLPFYDLIMNSDNLNYLTLKGLNWETTLSEFTTFFNKVKTLKGLDENGAEMPNINAQISGKVYLTESITSELLEEINALFPELVIVVNGAPQYFLTFKDYKNETICRYIADENSTPLDPTKDKIPGLNKTPAEILALLNEKPGEDKDKGEENPEGEIDTRFIFDFWIDFPEKVTSSAIFVPSYKTQYLVKFFNAENKEYTNEKQWVSSGEGIIDPTLRENNPLIPLKSTTAQYTYTYEKWVNKNSEEINLNSIQWPTNLYPYFKSETNKYLVKIYAGEKMMLEQRISYGSSVELPTEEIYKYFWDEVTGTYKYFGIYTHIGWDINQDGIDDGKTIVIAPQSYTTEPIYIHALFSSNLTIEDDWATIIENCEKNNYKDKYPVGAQKEVTFTYNGRKYSGIVEIVEQDYDVLVEPTNGKTTASLTFMLKDIFYSSTVGFDGNSWTDENNNTITAYVAGGWRNSSVYKPITSITFSEEILNNKIQKVKKKTDRGPNSGGNYHSVIIAEERIWTPSATEMGVLPSTISDSEAFQSADGSGAKGAYMWFTNNNSRIKTYQGVKTGYWTRTYCPTTKFRYYGVNETGGIGMHSNSFGFQSFNSYGLIFGFCI